MLAVTYVGSLYLRGAGIDGWSPMVAGGLLACAELAHWSIDSRLPAQDEPDVHRQRGVAVGVVTGLALALAAIEVSAARGGPLAGLLPTVAATAGSLLAFTGVAWLIWRGVASSTQPEELRSGTLATPIANRSHR